MIIILLIFIENRWDYFKSFSEDFMNKENNYNSLIPLDFTNRMPLPSFKKLLKYLYTNRLDIDLVSAIWIMKYSGYYLLSEELEERCRKVYILILIYSYYLEVYL
jgi:hypothetical protein